MHSFFRIFARPQLFAYPARRSLIVRALAMAATMDPMDPMDQAKIKVHNTLSPGAPVPLEPIKKGHISWYVCGPTVYDLSHLGHARNYVTTDVIRRILRDYFGFKLTFVENVTDVDDKIIIRARRARLLDLEKKKPYTPAELHALASRAFQAYAKANLPLLLTADGLDANNYLEQRDAAYGTILAGGTLAEEGKPGDAEAKVKMHLGNMDAAAAALRKEVGIFGDCDEILLPYLDSLYKETIDTSDQTIFTDLTRRMEDGFFKDMDSLNVLRPDHLTRVTEYVPQIVDFVAKIQEKGFAYDSEGSVYFDIAAFEKAGNTYARLRPEARNDKALQEEGEGSLSKNLGGKKSPGDFALWKKSKAGEPFWPSPWGAGRPGWHIECSVMASDVLGSVMDIHSGGIDLCFPHHDNELAQSEAFFCENGKEHVWVKTFLHMGHLSIAGSKMSKSLKNFQTIQDALATSYTARNMRIVFMLGRWNDGVEISPQMRTQADSWEKTVNAFFTNAKSWLQEAKGSTVNIKGLSVDDAARPEGLVADLEQAKSDMTAALADSFDTPAAMRIILDIINKVNVHKDVHKADADLSAVEAVARWVTKIVGIFGLDAGAKLPYEGLGWASTGSSLDIETTVKPMFVKVRSDVEALGLSSASPSLADLLSKSPESEHAKLKDSGELDAEALAFPFVRAAAAMRDELRRLVSTVDAGAKKAILGLSDRIRDYDLTNIGVYLDDRSDGQPSLVKFVPAEQLIAARESKAAEAAAKVRAKEEARLAKEKAEQEKWAKASAKPEDMFRGDERYAEWDGDGMPVKMKDGSEVPKSQLKKLKKEWDRQKKAYGEYVAKFGSGGDAA